MPKKQKKAVKKPEMASKFDLLGSYTGCYLIGENEEPVQDVDDL